MTITTLLIAGAVVGLVASLYPNRRLGCAILWIVPVATLFVVNAELSDPARRPDALDVLNYFFGPLWSSVGAMAGFTAARSIRHWIVSRRARRRAGVGAESADAGLEG